MSFDEQPDPLSDCMEWCAKAKVEIARLKQDRREYLEALASCWNQFAIETTVKGRRNMNDGGLSTLETVCGILEDEGYIDKDGFPRDM